MWFGKERSEHLQHICSDMWKPYMNVIKKKAGINTKPLAVIKKTGEHE
jgi:hypothetical protein